MYYVAKFRITNKISELNHLCKDVFISIFVKLFTVQEPYDCHAENSSSVCIYKNKIATISSANGLIYNVCNDI